MPGKWSGTRRSRPLLLAAWAEIPGFFNHASGDRARQPGPSTAVCRRRVVGRGPDQKFARQKMEEAPAVYTCAALVEAMWEKGGRAWKAIFDSLPVFNRQNSVRVGSRHIIVPIRASKMAELWTVYEAWATPIGDALLAWAAGPDTASLPTAVRHFTVSRRG